MTTIEDLPIAYSSTTFTIADDVIYVVNGANVGDAILKFDTNGNYLGEYPGYFNFPVDVVLGPAGQPLVSAIGAQGDDGRLRFGMVLYTSEGEFLHGLQEAETGLVRPYGLSYSQMRWGPWSADWLVLADWAANRTVVAELDWAEGSVTAVQNLTDTPFPFRVAVSQPGDPNISQRIAIISSVCCEPWHADLNMLSVVDMQGNLITEVHTLPTGEVISWPESITFDPAGNIVISDQFIGTHLLTGEAEYLDRLAVDGVPSKIAFYNGRMFVLTQVETGLDQYDSFISVYTYNL